MNLDGILLPRWIWNQLTSACGVGLLLPPCMSMWINLYLVSCCHLQPGNHCALAFGFGIWLPPSIWTQLHQLYKWNWIGMLVAALHLSTALPLIWAWDSCCQLDPGNSVTIEFGFENLVATLNLATTYTWPWHGIIANALNLCTALHFMFWLGFLLQLWSRKNSCLEVIVDWSSCYHIESVKYLELILDKDSHCKTVSRMQVAARSQIHITV